MRATLKTAAVAVPKAVIRKTPCAWSRPIIKAGNTLAEGLLWLRGYRRREVYTSQGTMHALVCKGRGKMRPLVILPGLGSRITDYGWMLWRFKRKFSRVIAIDLPGHGKSQLRVPIDSNSFSKAIVEAKSALAPEPSFMLGHSLGALGTMKSYLLAPHEVMAMALVTPPGGPVSPKVIKQYTRQFDIRSWHDAQAIADMTEPRDCWPHLFSPAGVAQRLTTPPVRQLLLSDVLTAHLNPEHLALMPRHTMFVWAGREALLPSAFRNYFIKHLPPTTRVWEPFDMTHGEIAWGNPRRLKPIVQFFEHATRELARDPRVRHAGHGAHATTRSC